MSTTPQGTVRVSDTFFDEHRALIARAHQAEAELERIIKVLNEVMAERDTLSDELEEIKRGRYEA